VAEEEVRHPIVSSGYDAVMVLPERFLGLGDQRRRTLEPARGRVLDIGAGTGRNLPFYPRIDRLVAVEPDPHMLRRAAVRHIDGARGFPVDGVAALAEALPFGDDSFDTVVFCLVLCTVARPRRAVEEARRVLRPDGDLLLLEHVRSPRPTVRWLQHAATPLWRHIAGGCHLDRSTETTVTSAGFRFEHLWRSRHGRGTFIQGRARAT
jgi:SAM-dependent methyltransferase